MIKVIATAKPILIIMVGPSASGKSSMAQELSRKFGFPIISTDAIRAGIAPGGVPDQSKNKKVFKEFYKRINEALANEGGAIADATNITIRSRATLIREAAPIGPTILAYAIIKSKEQCLKDNKSEERLYPVPDRVIEKQFRQFVMPTKGEGVDRIVLNYVGKGGPFVSNIALDSLYIK